MKKRNGSCIALSAGLLILFVLYTIAIQLVDVQPIGPQGSSVGLGTVNGWLHHFLGVNMLLYYITDWASIAALLIAMGFTALGVVQLIKRKICYVLIAIYLYWADFICSLF